MANIKHVGRQINNKRKCVVAYRVVPNDGDNCLVVFTDSLEAADHDFLMKLVESNSGQNAYEFAEAMARNTLSDGRNMLSAFHNMGKLTKMPTTAIELTPNTQTTANLAEVNDAVAQQKGVTVEDLALQGTETKAKPQAETTQSIAEDIAVEPLQAGTDGVLTDEDLAAQYRSQADRLYKEAKALREQAEELSPTKRKTAKKKESV